MRWGRLLIGARPAEVRSLGGTIISIVFGVVPGIIGGGTLDAGGTGVGRVIARSIAKLRLGLGDSLLALALIGGIVRLDGILSRILGTILSRTNLSHTHNLDQDTKS